MLTPWAKISLWPMILPVDGSKEPVHTYDAGLAKRETLVEDTFRIYHFFRIEIYTHISQRFLALHLFGFIGESTLRCFPC